MSVTLKPVVTPVDQEKLAGMALEIWQAFWPALIGQDMTDYMIDKFQSLEAIRRDVAEHGYEYWFICDGAGRVVGYAGGCVEAEAHRFFISKIYLYAAERGKHYGSQTIALIEKLCHERGLASMYLDVYRENVTAINAYRANGFTVTGNAPEFIGGGFDANGLIMEKALTSDKA